MILSWRDALANTLTFNTPVAAPIYLLQGIDGFGDPVVDIHTIKGPYQDGSTFLDAVLEERVVTLRVMIFGTSDADLQTRKSELVAAFNPKLGPGTLIWEPHTGLVRHLTAVSDGAPSFPAPGPGVGFQECLIVLRATDPHWYEAADRVLALLPGVQQTIINNGNVPTPVTLEIHGPITNPTVVNTAHPAGERTIRWNGTVGAGQILTVITAFGRKTVRLGVSNMFSGVDITTTFWSLPRGSNPITLTGTGTTTATRCDVRWRERFVAM